MRTARDILIKRRDTNPADSHLVCQIGDGGEAATAEFYPRHARVGRQIAGNQ